jgi:hypothetical protein
MTGFKATFNLTSNPATNFLGPYTLVVDVPTNAAAPKGNGYGTIIMKTNGLTSPAGRLGDYAPFKPVVVPISEDGDWPLYATTYIGVLPYTGIVKGVSMLLMNKETKGMIMGWMKFSNTNGTYAARELLDSRDDGFAEFEAIRPERTSAFHSSLARRLRSAS